jgi:hypothetical protein
MKSIEKVKKIKKILNIYYENISKDKKISNKTNKNDCIAKKVEMESK